MLIGLVLKVVGLVPLGIKLVGLGPVRVSCHGLPGDRLLHGIAYGGHPWRVVILAGVSLHCRRVLGLILSLLLNLVPVLLILLLPGDLISVLRLVARYLVICL